IMWCRVAEIAIGCWLMMSPFIFRYSEREILRPTLLWWNDLLVGLLIATLALCSFRWPLRHAHLALLAVGLWQIGLGYFGGVPANPPEMQNEIFVGLFLLMFAILPNEADRPPESWERFLSDAEHRDAVSRRYPIKSR
ncbi:MAG: SPW repeat protein, partial [Planctomycetaceae bacterium]